jgi:drug/metabolite transporter (DMT)-like permease
MWIGTLFALAAGLMWGLVFVGPLWLHDYPAVLLSFGRYLAFGLIALPWAGWTAPSCGGCGAPTGWRPPSSRWWATSSTTCSWPRRCSVRAAPCRR